MTAQIVPACQKGRLSSNWNGATKSSHLPKVGTNKAAIFRFKFPIEHRRQAFAFVIPERSSHFSSPFQDHPQFWQSVFKFLSPLKKVPILYQFGLHVNCNQLRLTLDKSSKLLAGWKWFQLFLVFVSIQQSEQFVNFCCWHLSIFKCSAPFTLCNNRFPTPLLFHTCSLACYDSPGKLCLLHPAGLLLHLLLHLKPSSTSSPRLPPLPKPPLDLAPARRVVAPHQVAAREGVSKQKCFKLVLCNLVVNPDMWLVKIMLSIFTHTTDQRIEHWQQQGIEIVSPSCHGDDKLFSSLTDNSHQSPYQVCSQAINTSFHQAVINEANLII